jgi:Alanine dehydrogenase/PNT, N-terminal domain
LECGFANVESVFGTVLWSMDGHPPCALSSVASKEAKGHVGAVQRGWKGSRKRKSEEWKRDEVGNFRTKKNKQGVISRSSVIIMAPQPLWLRCEKKEFERRSALTPTTAKKLIDAGFVVTVERDPQRIFDDEEFEKYVFRAPDRPHSPYSWVGSPELAALL